MRGARTHNLRDVDVDILRGAWTAVVGVSGSGKSSLVFDTLVAESRRRYLATLKHAVAGMDLAPRPPVDAVDGLPPAVATGFGAGRLGPRATLGTLADVARAVQTLAARLGTAHCPTCDTPLPVTRAAGLVDELLALPAGTRLVLVAEAAARGAEAVDAAREAGYVRVRREDGRLQRVEEATDVGAEEALGIVVDRLVVAEGARERFAASVDTAFALGEGRLGLVDVDRDARAMRHVAAMPWCPNGHGGFAVPTPATVSADHPDGACPTCAGRGTVYVLPPERTWADGLSLSSLAGALARAAERGQGEAIRRAVRAWRAEARARGRVRFGDLPTKRREALWSMRLGRSGPTLGDALTGPRAAQRFGQPATCPTCNGTRRGAVARALRWHGVGLGELEAWPLSQLRAWLERVALPGALGELLEPVRDDAVSRLAFLGDVGLGYLALGRAADTLSGGEVRRAELAATCAARMSGLLLALDEPTAGLHPDERELLARRLRTVVDDGNTLLTVDHDERLLAAADRVLVLGPGAGAEGGRVLFEGTLAAAAKDAEAGPLLPRAPDRLELAHGPAAGTRHLAVRGARARTLRSIDVAFPLGHVSVVAGVSGAGKSTLVLDVLAPAVQRAIAGGGLADLPLDGLDGASSLTGVIVGAGRPGRHPRATAATVLGVASPLRSLFARTLEAKARGWNAAWFGTHAPGGRCETCAGTGWRTLALPDAPAVRVPCDVCGGRRFRAEAERARWRGLSLADVLERPLAEMADVFRDVPALGGPLGAARDVGLGYVRLGEPLHALSSGEGLRLRLAAALGRAGLQPTLFVLDEPCLGLHPLDVRRLLQAFDRLVERGHTVITVEHHVEVMAHAAHVVELGPGPGDDGGRVVFAGSPRELARADTSTGRLLRP